MKKFAWTLSIVVIGGAIAMAQPPEGPRGGGRGGDFRLPPNPFVEALDTDGDGVISADELKGASESLAKLDANKDGKLADDELRPRPPAGDRGPDDRGPGSGPGAGNRGRGGDGRGAEGRGPASGRGGDARGPQGRGGPGRDGGPGREGGPGGAGGPGGRGPDGGRGPEGPGGPPSPERFVEHAMEFDADKDGKLNHDELAKFAQEMIQRRGGGPGGQGGPGGEGRPNGPGNGGGRPESGERPRRPE